MLTRALRRGAQREEGQALVLACLLMLILSIALMTTVNIGHSVHERIRLQNTADAAAYSTAAMEARAFNFYAFTNRTQVSHYVSAMIWQSTDSFLFSVQAFLTDIYGLIRTIGPCFPKDSRSGIVWPIICGILDNLPYIGVVMKALDAIMMVLKNLLVFIKSGLDIADQVIGTMLIPMHRLLNASMAGASTAVMLSTSTYVMGTSNAILQANDPNLKPGAAQALTGALNQCLYSRAHYEEANGKPLSPANPLHALDPTRRNEDDKVARAKRVMAGIANASRYACDKGTSGFNLCPETLVTDRRLGQLMPLPKELSMLEDLLDAIPKWGQTRLLTYKLGYGGVQEAIRGDNAKKQNKIRESRDLPNSPMGMIAQGDVLGSDDPYYLKLGPHALGASKLGEIYNPFSCPKYYEKGGDERSWRNCWGDPREDRDSTLETSIWAMSSKDFRRNGIHWRVVFPGEAKSQSDRQVGLYEFKPCLARLAGICMFKELAVFVANTHIDPRDSNHPWEGIVPFPHFEPGQYAGDCVASAFSNASTREEAGREQDFNQPSTWVMLNKNAQQLQNGNASDATGATHNSPALLNSTGKFTFTLGSSSQTLDLDNDRKKFLSFSEGMNVISRGQTYYHRPGNWAEQPNFFNPYWRPRLAAVWQGKKSLPLIEQLSNALPAAVRDAPAKIITH